MGAFSELARPPIRPEEAAAAEHSICVLHDGLVRQTGDREGRVMWCPVGRQYWRYTRKARSDFTSPLPYPQSGVV